MSTTLSKGTLLQGSQNKYQIVKVLGQGTFGITYLARYKAQVKGTMGQGSAWTLVCIKEFFMKDLSSRDNDGSLVETSEVSLVGKYRKSFIREANNLSKMHHPGIVNVFEVFEANNTVYIVMEYIDGGNLDDFIKARGRMTEAEAMSSFSQICSAIKYMHSQNMLHLDLKPKNVMRDEEGHLYLIDFGLSKQYDNNGEPESSTMIGLGTPGYAPIEQAKHLDNDKNFQATIDIYALGATLYKMMTGQTPPDATDVSNSMLDEVFIIKDNLIKAGISTKTAETVSKAMWPSSKKRIQNVTDLETLLDLSQDEQEENTIFANLEEERTGEIKKEDRIEKEDKSYHKGVLSIFRRFVDSQKDRHWFVTLILGVMLVISIFGLIITFLGALDEFWFDNSSMGIYGGGDTPLLLFCVALFWAIIQTLKFKRSPVYWLTPVSIILMLLILGKDGFKWFLLFSVFCLLGIGLLYLLLKIRKFGKSSWSLSEKPSKFTVIFSRVSLSVWALIVLLPYFAAWSLGFKSNLYSHGLCFIDSYLSHFSYDDSLEFAESIASSEDFQGSRKVAEKWYQRSLDLIEQVNDEFSDYYMQSWLQNWYAGYILFKAKVGLDSLDAVKYYREAYEKFGKEKIDQEIRRKVYDGWEESFVKETLDFLHESTENLWPIEQTDELTPIVPAD